jgi:acyl-CoA dehydrogenase
MATRIEAGINLYQKAARLLDHRRVQPHLISMAEWHPGETTVRIAEEALRLHGGYGFIGDYNIECFYWGCMVIEIYEGTKEIEEPNL